MAPSGAGDSAVRYSYDARSRKTAVHYPNNASATYSYDDARGGWVSEIVHTGATGQLLRLAYARQDDGLITRIAEERPDGDQTWAYEYDNLTGYSQVLAEVGATEEDSRSYVYGQEHLPLAQLGGGSGPAFFHGDHLGTTRQLTGPAGNALLASPANYSPFGDPENAALSSLTSMAYTGQHRDSATDLQYHRARWLSTEKGRWLSEDPVFDFPANFGNRYGYVGGGVANAFDISGMQTLGEQTSVAGTIGKLSIAGLKVYDIYEVGGAWWIAVTAPTGLGVGGAALLTVLLIVPGSGVAKRMGTAVKKMSGGTLIRINKGLRYFGDTAAIKQADEALIALKKNGNWKDAEVFVQNLYDNIPLQKTVVAQSGEIAGRRADAMVSFLAGSQKHLVEVKHWSRQFMDESVQLPKAWTHALSQAAKDADALVMQGVNKVDWHFTKAMLPDDKLDELMMIFKNKGVEVNVFQYS